MLRGIKMAYVSKVSVNNKNYADSAISDHDGVGRDSSFLENIQYGNCKKKKCKTNF